MGVRINGEFLGELAIQMTHLPSGVTINTDPPVDNGGKGASFSPTDLLATAYGSCMMSVIALEAQRKKIELTGMRIEIEKHMSTSPPRRVARLDIRLFLPKHISTESMANLERIGRGCPVAKSISEEIEIDFALSQV